MPVRLSTSSVLRWPDWQTVRQALQGWAQEVEANCPNVVRIGYFGSYARGDWGVGSDLDLVIVVRESARSFETRAVDFAAEALPVPVDMLVYTEEEWQTLSVPGTPGTHLSREVKWVCGRDVPKTLEGLDHG
jgi:predicted nucleotidyltransferase